MNSAIIKQRNVIISKVTRSPLDQPVNRCFSQLCKTT